MIGARTLCLVAALATLCCIASCGDDSDSGVSRFEVSYFIPAGRGDIQRLFAVVEYAGPERLLSSPSGVPAFCVSAASGAVIASDSGLGRVEIEYCGCDAFSTCGITGICDSDVALVHSTADGVVDGRHIFDCTFDLIGAAENDYFVATVTQAFDAGGNVVPTADLTTSVRAAPTDDPPSPLPDDASDYDVTVSVINDAGLIGALQFDLIYLGDLAGWRGSGGGVRCSWHTSGAITACNDVGQGRARCALADLAGFETPSEVATCRLAAVSEPTLRDLLVVVVDASDPDFQPASVQMNVTGVEAIEPVPEPPPDAARYDVTASIVNEAGLIGALQFDITHLGGTGGWQGAGGDVRCTWQTPGGITACNDVGAGRVRCALADITGFETPTDVVDCTFVTNDDDVTRDSFAITVIDASTPEFEPSNVTMEITSVEPR